MGAKQSEREKIFDNLLTYDQLAEWLGYKKTTLYTLVFRDEIPHIRINGKRTMFSRHQIMEWIEGSRKKGR